MKRLVLLIIIVLVASVVNAISFHSQKIVGSSSGAYHAFVM